MSGRSPTDIRSVCGSDTLLFGIGNCSRGDDGLGWAFLDRVVQQADFQGQAEYRYQLGVEDAALVARAGRVIFIDSCNGPLDGGFAWQQCEASAEFEFTSHVLPPGAVMHYCRELYGKHPPADILMISGECWGLQNGLSETAGENLENAIGFFRTLTA